MTPQKSKLASADLLPDPDLLRYYNEQGGPGTGKKIVDEFVATIAHKRLLEQNKQQWDYDLQKKEQQLQFWAQIFAFFIAITAIAGGIWLANKGSTQDVVTGGFITSGTVAGIVYAFLKTRQPPTIK